MVKVTISQFKKLYNQNVDELLKAINWGLKQTNYDIDPILIFFDPFKHFFICLIHLYKKPLSINDRKLILNIQSIFQEGCNLNSDTDILSETDNNIIFSYQLINDPVGLFLLNEYDSRNKTSYAHSFKVLLYEFACLIVNNLESQTDDQLALLEDYNAKFLKVNSIDTEQNQISKNTKDVNECLDQIYKLVGLDPVKKEIQNLINLIRVNQIRLERGIGSVSPFSHLVFTGNPGTGKTTVARLLGDIYAGLGLLDSGHLVETDRSGLIAGYVGQTAIKVSDVFKSALGGVLFIDEAYSLIDDGKTGYGQEAIDTLMKLIEDHRGKILVIVAGYPENMEKFLNANPGMKSRFNKTIFFPDYSINELLEVLTKLAANSGFTFSEDAIQKSLSLLSENADKNGNLPGNARFVRNLFHEIISNQANRIVNELKIDDDALQRIEASDVCL